MAMRPNYNQQRTERDRAKEQKKRERLQRRGEDAQKRKSEQDHLLRGPSPDSATPPPADTVEKE